jgi:hypothetical protein
MSQRHVGTPRAPLEKVEQANIVRLLRSLGAAVYTIGTRRAKGDHQGTRQSCGLPDIVAFIPRCGLVMIEVKSVRGRLREEQREFQQHCRDHHVAHVVGGLDVVIQYLVGVGVLCADQVSQHHFRMVSHG